MDSLTSTKIFDPNTFVFFKGFDFADGAYPLDSLAFWPNKLTVQ